MGIFLGFEIKSFELVSEHINVFRNSKFIFAIICDTPTPLFSEIINFLNAKMYSRPRIYMYKVWIIKLRQITMIHCKSKQYFRRNCYLNCCDWYWPCNTWSLLFTKLYRNVRVNWTGFKSLFSLDQRRCYNFCGINMRSKI